LARASEQTCPELRRSLLRAVAKVDPAADIKRHRRARAERFLRVDPCADGMAELTGRMPAEDAATVFGAVDAVARAAAPDDPRSIDARRVDALVDLCRLDHTDHYTDAWAGNRAAHRARRRGRGGSEIRVTVAATTLLGLDNEPAELAGFGPIDAETARRIAADLDATPKPAVLDDPSTHDPPPY
jgi:hypothetical protein